MSNYIITHEQLDCLQDQVQQLTRQNDVKQKRIKELEFHKARVLNNETADLIMTIGKLKNEIEELKKSNERLTEEISSSKANAIKFEKLLEEERKLRKYSQKFFKPGEESLNGQLTSELCQDQNTEIDIDNERIKDMQKKLNKFTDEVENPQVPDPKDVKETVNIQNNESSQSIKQLKSIIEQLKSQLFDLHNSLKNNLVKTSEDQYLKEIGKWLKETKLIMADVNNIEMLNKELMCLRQEIESRRKSMLK